MRKLTVLSLTVCLTFAVSAFADEEQTPPGLKKKGGVPPGLQKKGGVPPGQAKKQEAANESEPTQTVAAVKPTPAAPSVPAPPASPATPTAAQPPATPAPVAPAAQPAPVKTPAPPATPTAPKPTVSKQALKATLNHEVEALKDRFEDKNFGQPALKKISSLTGVSVDQLQERRDDHGAAFPALLLGHMIAKSANTSFKQVMNERKNGASWSAIADRHRVDVEPLLNSLMELKTHLAQVQQRRS